jgi:hypothetical protein
VQLLLRRTADLPVWIVVRVVVVVVVVVFEWECATTPQVDRGLLPCG